MNERQIDRKGKGDIGSKKRERCKEWGEREGETEREWKRFPVASQNEMCAALPRWVPFPSSLISRAAGPPNSSFPPITWYFLNKT